jgi:hypothetical protein
MILIGSGLSACNKSPTTPTPGAVAIPTNQVGSVTVSGPSLLGIGQVAHLSGAVAYATHYDTVLPTTAAWTSSDPSVVAVDATGTVTALAVGSASISLTAGGRTGSVTIPVFASTAISGCGFFSTGHVFTVANDIGSGMIGCVQFSNLMNATIDCQGHDISSVTIASSTLFSMKNCKLHQGSLFTLRVFDSHQVTVDASEVFGAVTLQNVQDSSFTNSVFRWPQTSISCGLYSGEIYLKNGSGNRFAQDTIDGNWDGNMQTYMHEGCDDGIILDNEQNITIANSTLANVWDAGIEPYSPTSTAFVIANATISGNTFSHDGYTGIGDYWGPGWLNSTFSGNTSTATPSLIYFRPEREMAGVTFANNRILGNVVQGQVPLPPVYGGDLAAPIHIGYPDDATTSSNLIQGNDFGSILIPLLSPVPAFVDGGGNRCLPIPGRVIKCIALPNL